MGSGVCVVGSLNVDYVVRADALPGRGETILGESFRTCLGGKGANQAVAAARLGAQVTLLGAVGDDAHGAALREGLAADRIDLRHLRIRKDAPTAVAFITVARGGENMIVVSPGANGTLRPADVESAEESIRNARILVAQLEVPLDAVARAAEIAAEAGVPFLLNAAPARRLDSELLEWVRFLVVNEEEARAVSGRGGERPGRCAEEILDLGASAAVVTLGAEGAIFLDAHGLRRQDAFRVDALDAVGAGDAFVGAFAVALAEGMKVDRALRFACAAGALATTKEGAIPSLPRRPEVDRLCRP
ncbi:MAG TPA: ribokinase [Planctomycetota bacterium]|jgi:ribokinase|nr:ribokinase [Planctomycetota bacterium]